MAKTAVKLTRAQLTALHRVASGPTPVKAINGNTLHALYDRGLITVGITKKGENVRITGKGRRILAQFTG